MQAWHVIRTAVTQQLPHPLDPPASNYSNAEHELDDLESLYKEIPCDWIRATVAVLNADGPWPLVIPDPPSMPSAAEQQVEAMLVARLGWKNRSGRAVSVAQLTVKAATAMQLGPLRAERRDRHCMFVQAALGTAASQAAVELCVKCVAAALRRLWKLRWDNALNALVMPCHMSLSHPRLWRAIKCL
jgi:hypothetical protein